MAEIKHLVTIEAEPAVVYAAITEQAGLASWWTEETVADATVGSVLEFRFGEEYHNKMRLTRLVSDQRVEWECIQGHDEWVGTRFTFDLEGGQGRTTLRFSHYQWAEATDFYANCNFHWGYYMQSLKTYCETGQGTPFAKA